MKVINVNFNPAVKQQLILIAANSVVWMFGLLKNNNKQINKK